MKAKLTDAERAVLEEIRNRPFSTQKELANKLRIARTTVATYVDRLQSKGYIHGRAYVLAEEVSVCCIGGMTIDRTLLLKEPGILGTSNPAIGHQNRGGVARNVAENLARLSVSCKLISVVGNDQAGASIVNETRQVGVDVSLVATEQQHATGSYSAIISPDGELFIGIADLEICQTMNKDFVDQRWSQIAAAKLVFVDTNAPSDTLQYLLTRCREKNVPLCVDAVSVPKATKLPDDLAGVELLFCNANEANAMLGADVGSAAIEGLARGLLGKGVSNAVVSAGRNGICVASASGATLLPAFPTEVVDVSGAGDALIAGTICGRLMGYEPVESCRMGLVAASMSARSVERNSAELSVEALMTNLGIEILEPER